MRVEERPDISTSRTAACLRTELQGFSHREIARTGGVSIGCAHDVAVRGESLGVRLVYLLLTKIKIRRQAVARGSTKRVQNRFMFTGAVSPLWITADGRAKSRTWQSSVPHLNHLRYARLDLSTRGRELRRPSSFVSPFSGGCTNDKRICGDTTLRRTLAPDGRATRSTGARR